VVVGEDLGTVEPWVRDYLARRGLLGTSILWFELDRDGDGGPLACTALARILPVLGHHPRPTADGRAIWQGEHVRLRAELGLLTRPVDEELADDMAEQSAWVDELRRVGLLGEKPGVDETVLGALPIPRAAPRHGCSACRLPMRSAKCAPRTSPAPMTNTRTGACPSVGPTGAGFSSKSCSPTPTQTGWPRP
jgi:4-alpha-glucanotransferase